MWMLGMKHGFSETSFQPLECLILLTVHLPCRNGESKVIYDKICFFYRINNIFFGLKEQIVETAIPESPLVENCQHTFCLQKTKDSGKCWWIWQSTWFCMIVSWRFFESTSLGLERLSLCLELTQTLKICILFLFLMPGSTNWPVMIILQKKRPKPLTVP